MVPSNDNEKPKEYKGGWVLRTLLNKTQPNEEWVVSKLVENIESHINKQDLIKCVTTDKELGDEFKIAPSRFASKKPFQSNSPEQLHHQYSHPYHQQQHRSWKPNHFNSSHGSNSYNSNNTNNVHSNNSHPVHFSHHSSGSNLSHVENDL